METARGVADFLQQLYPKVPMKPPGYAEGGVGGNGHCDLQIQRPRASTHGLPAGMVRIPEILRVYKKSV